MKQHKHVSVILPKPAQQMTTGDIMRLAHKLTKSAVQPGDSYSATFGLCLKLVYAAVREGLELHSKMTAKPVQVYSKSITYKPSLPFLVLIWCVFTYFVGNALYASAMGSVGYTVFHLIGALLSGLIGAVEYPERAERVEEPLTGAAKFLLAKA